MQNIKEKIIRRKIEMSFLLHQLGQLGMVAVIMVCALLGTVGIIKLIKKIFPFNEKKNSKKDQADSEV